jgi:hypothetical protein
MTNENASLIAHTACLCPDCTVDTALPGYAAVEAVDTCGATHYLLALVDAIGDEHIRYDPTCSDVIHDQLGPLPLEFVRRITISQRTHRCGRPTKTTGRPCRIEVTRPGEACGLHRTGEPANGQAS